MPEKVLFVDDEPNVLSGIERQLRKDYDVLTAMGGAAGLAALETEPDVAVIVSDMRMPEMNGAEFLARASAVRPDAVRMILSGQAELESTIRAVNEGQLFRFLTKPCERDDLKSAVDAALTQYRLVIAERELLQKTLSGSVELLTEVLSLVNPVAFSRSTRVQRFAMGVADQLGLEDTWQLRLACMLSQLGCVTVPKETLANIFAGRDVPEEEASQYASQAQVAAKLIERIPRLDGVARIVAGHQTEQPSRREDASDSVAEATEVLRAAAEFDLMLSRGVPAPQALKALETTTPRTILEALSVVSFRGGTPESKAMTVKELTVGMVVEEQVLSSTGVLLVAPGHEITQTTLVYLRRFAEGQGVKEPFSVQLPRATVDAVGESDAESGATAAMPAA